MILIDAAFSLEHLCKAYLYDKHPALLMEIRNGQFDSLLHLTGLGGSARKLKAPRTISAKEALARVEQLMTVRTPRLLLDQLIDVRDGVVHAGYLSPTNTREVLTVFLRFSNELYEELGVEELLRWADHSTLVASLISQSLSEIDHEVQRKITAAQQRLAKLMSSVPENQQVAVGDARQALTPSYAFFEPGHNTGETPIERLQARCPACNHPGASLWGQIEWDSIERTKASPMAHREKEIEHYELFWPTRLFCGSCDLRLDSPDELEIAGFTDFHRRIG